MAAGTLDTSFGDLGTVTHQVNAPLFGRATAVAVQPDGKVISAGQVDYYSLSPVIVRYNADGSLDPTFGRGGKVQFTESGPVRGFVRAVALQRDGKILFVGADTGGEAFCVRLNADGSTDTSFGQGGAARISFGDAFRTEPRSVVVLPDGKIVLGGRVSHYRNGSAFDNGMFARLLPTAPRPRLRNRRPPPRLDRRPPAGHRVRAGPARRQRPRGRIR